jgi:hypothetical protein
MAAAEWYLNVAICVNGKVLELWHRYVTFTACCLKAE